MTTVLITSDSKSNQPIDAKSFENYQRFTEQTISNLSNQITSLEEQLNVFTNLFTSTREF